MRQRASKKWSTEKTDDAEAKRKHAVLFVIGAAVRCLWIKRERGDSSTVSRREG